MEDERKTLLVVCNYGSCATCEDPDSLTTFYRDDDVRSIIKPSPLEISAQKVYKCKTEGSHLFLRIASQYQIIPNILFININRNHDPAHHSLQPQYVVVWRLSSQKLC